MFEGQRASVRIFPSFRRLPDLKLFMRPEEAIVLVFAIAVVWTGTILMLLTRKDRPERQARRPERKAERMAQRRVHYETRPRPERRRRP
jgi:hypothetical protein